MIDYLEGKIQAKLPHSLIVNVQGVGYGVEMPLSALSECGLQGEQVSLWIETYVREDALKLYGFISFDDRQAFSMLRSVSGIGPKMALAILSTLDAKSLRQTVLTNRVEILESVPGVGKRTAEKLILELKPKMEKLSFASSGLNKAGASKSPRSPIDDIAVLENLDDKTSDFGFDRHILDLRSALENLGYKEKDISSVVINVRSEFKNTSDVDFSIVLKSALRSLRASL
jgi:Holliday junction DNA helicase RuvA